MFAQYYKNKEKKLLVKSLLIKAKVLATNVKVKKE